MMKYWNNILPNFILNIRYEDLILNTKDEINIRISQIKDDCIIIAPIIEKNNKQVLKKFTKKNNKFIEKKLCDVSFVPNLKGIKNQ